MPEEKGIWIITDETAIADGAKSGSDIGADYQFHRYDRQSSQKFSPKMQEF